MIVPDLRLGVATAADEGERRAFGVGGAGQTKLRVGVVAKLAREIPFLIERGIAGGLLNEATPGGQARAGNVFRIARTLHVETLACAADGAVGKAEFLRRVVGTAGGEFQSLRTNLGAHARAAVLNLAGAGAGPSLADLRNRSAGPDTDRCAGLGTSVLEIEAKAAETPDLIALKSPLRTVAAASKLNHGTRGGAGRRKALGRRVARHRRAQLPGVALRRRDRAPLLAGLIAIPQGGVRAAAGGRASGYAFGTRRDQRMAFAAPVDALDAGDVVRAEPGGGVRAFAVGHDAVLVIGAIPHRPVVGPTLFLARAARDRRRIRPLLLMVEAERVAELVHDGAGVVGRIEAHAVAAAIVGRKPARFALAGGERRTARVLRQAANDHVQAGPAVGAYSGAVHRIVAIPAEKVDARVARPFLDGAAALVPPRRTLGRSGPKGCLRVDPADIDVDPAFAGIGPQRGAVGEDHRREVPSVGHIGTGDAHRIDRNGGRKKERDRCASLSQHQGHRICGMSF